MIFLALIISFVIVLLITPLMMKLAHRFDFLDYPEQRKLHFKPTPLLGGVGVFVGFWLGLIFVSSLVRISWKDDIAGLFLGSLIIIGLGLIDDKRGMNPSVKLSGQITASLIFIILSQSSGMVSNSLWGNLILVLWMVGLMNALNFLDNMDGLCSGISVIAALAFIVLAYFTGGTILLLISLALIGSLLGFLKYNFSPAKIFLGDTGSMFCGFILSAMSIIFARQDGYYLNRLVPLLILSYPIFDISFVTLTRLKEGRRFYQGGRDHSSHRIIEMGIHPRLTVWGIYFVCLLLATTGVITFFFLESPLKVLIVVFAGFLLTIFGVHLNRNFAHIRQKATLVLADVVILNLIFLFVYWLRFQSKIFPTQIIIPLAEYTAPAIWITLFWVNLFAILGLYDVDWEASLKQMWRSVFKSIGLGIAVFIILTLGQDYLLLRTWILLGVYAFCLTFLLVVERSILISWFRSLLSWGKVKRKAVILGTGDNAQKLWKDINSDVKSGYDVLGFVRHQSEANEAKIDQSQILGEVDDLGGILKKLKVHEVLVALQPEQTGSVGQMMNRVGGIEVNFKIPTELSNLAKGCKTSKLYRGRLLRVYPQPMRAWEWGIKRLADIVVSFLVLMLFSPVLLLTWFMLKFKLKYSVLIGQTYLGKSREPFKVHRFYLASQDEENSLSQSKLGRFLRRTRIEKLPILFSILKGEMSFVGPQLIYAKKNGDLPDGFSECGGSFNVKPGLWSLSWLKSGKPQKEMVNMEGEIFYMENMSLWLDVKVLFKGLINYIRKVLFNR